MEFFETQIAEVVLLRPKVFGDGRGCFFESFNARAVEDRIGPFPVVQINHSESCYGVIRGLHFQRGAAAQAKLVRVLSGGILDVAVDIRRGSPTFGLHVAVELSADNRLQLFVPRGFAHGFSVLSPHAEVEYLCDNCYDPAAEGAVAWNDPQLGIDWQIPAGDAILSDRDRCHPRLQECEELFEYFPGGTAF